MLLNLDIADMASAILILIYIAEVPSLLKVGPSYLKASTSSFLSIYHDVNGGVMVHSSDGKCNSNSLKCNSNRLHCLQHVLVTVSRSFLQ